MAKTPSWTAKVSRSNGLLHAQIADSVAAAIADGRLRPGDQLAPERELAKEFGVNRLTVRQALADLQLRRLIRRRTGRNGGTFIADPMIDYDLTTFAGFSAQARRHGRVAGSTMLRAELTDADAATLEALQLDPGSQVVVIDRLRLANGVPVLVEHSCFPAERFSTLLDEPLEGSIYDLLDERFGARPRRAVESHRARARRRATGQAARGPARAPLAGGDARRLRRGRRARRVRARRAARRPRAHRRVELRTAAALGDEPVDARR